MPARSLIFRVRWSLQRPGNEAIVDPKEFLKRIEGRERSDNILGSAFSSNVFPFSLFLRLPSTATFYVCFQPTQNSGRRRYTIKAAKAARVSTFSDLGSRCREEFIRDLLVCSAEHEEEIRGCLAKGAYKVQIDFTEGHESDRTRVLKIIQRYLLPEHRIFIGVVCAR